MIAQESRDELQRTKDQEETKGDELAVCRQQIAELEMRLGTLQVTGSENQEISSFSFATSWCNEPESFVGHEAYKLRTNQDFLFGWDESSTSIHFSRFFVMEDPMHKNNAGTRTRNRLPHPHVSKSYIFFRVQQFVERGYDPPQ